MATPLEVGSMFSGIGGLDLGLERAGMRVVWQSENDPYASRILHKHWPHVPNFGDVTTINWAEVPRVDLICGGYPCQPFSTAGRRLGDADPRHLWPHMRDAIRVLRPRWALLENVPGHLALGFGRVLGDLAEIGYDTEWDCIPAAVVGAPHLRWRVFIVAYPQRQPGHVRRSPLFRGRTDDTEQTRVGGSDVADPDPSRWDGRTGQLGQGRWTQPADSSGNVADPDSTRLEGPRLRRSATERGGDVADPHEQRPQGSRLPTRTDRQPVPDLGESSPRIFGRSPRSGDQWTVEPDVGRVAHGIPHRVDRLRTLGNAVVPQVAEHIGRLIIEADRAA